MNRIRKASVVALAIASLAVAVPAYAQQASAFMVIRFNQQRMYFDQQLYNAVAQAVSIKQDVMFELVSYSPQTGDADADASWRRTAEHNLGAVVSRMNAIGVPSSRLMTSVQPQQGLKYDEVHIFAH